MKEQEDTDRSCLIRRGDYVRSKWGLAEPIGVVWDIHPKNIASVEVYHPVNGKTRMPREYKPEDLVVVPAHEVPEHVVRFRATLER
jgi:hypothetical protein